MSDQPLQRPADLDCASNSESVPVYGGTWEVADWVAAGKALAVGSVDVWARLSPKMAEQWRTDLNGGLEITQVPADLSTVAFYWECAAGHLWRETPYLRRDVGRKTPRWKVVARTRAACRECTLEQHGARFGCGCLDRDLGRVGYTWPTAPACASCSGQVHHRWACGRRTWMKTVDQPGPHLRCPQCRTNWRKLERSPVLAARITAMAVDGLPVGHEKVRFWCGVDHHDPFDQDLSGIVRGFGCKLCFKISVTPGRRVEPGQVFRTSRPSATSAVEAQLREALAAHFRVSNLADANAVRIAGDFYGFRHVLPDILLPQLRVAVELDSPGRYGDGHRGMFAARDRLKDQKLAEVGWKVIRVRIDGLEAVDHAECIVAKSLTKTAIAEVVTLIEAHAQTSPCAGCAASAESTSTREHATAGSHLGSVGPTAAIE
jgi:very-short-patch-repair endonuclease